jgi:hypothetical protein
VEGELGCPICAARYAVHDGVANFRADVERAAETPHLGSNQALALRAAALLGLTEPGGLVVLAGDWSASANTLLEMTEGVQFLAVDPGATLWSHDALSLARIANVLPLAAACARGSRWMLRMRHPRSSPAPRERWRRAGG